MLQRIILFQARWKTSEGWSKFTEVVLENLSLQGSCSSFSLSSHSLSGRIPDLPRNCKSPIGSPLCPCPKYFVNTLTHLFHLSLHVHADYPQESFGNYRHCCKHFSMGHLWTMTLSHRITVCLPQHSHILRHTQKVKNHTQPSSESSLSHAHWSPGCSL